MTSPVRTVGGVGADHRPVLVTGDVALRDEVLRVAAAAGVRITVAADLVGVRPSWPTAPVILIGGDALADCAGGGLDRRPSIVVVTRAAPSAQLWEGSVAVGAERVLVLPAAESELVRRLGDIDEPRSDGGRVICCIGGRGGAGASVLAAGLAVSAARVTPGVLLVDLDPVGGGLDLVLGAESTAGLRWPDLSATAGRISAASLHDALPIAAGVAVVSAGRGGPGSTSADAARTVISAGRRSGHLVVADLPRMLTAAARTALRLADLTLLVVPAEVRACAAAAQVAAVLGEQVVRLEVVVRGPAPSGLSAQAVAASLRLPLAGWMRPEPGLAAALDRGEVPTRRGRGPLAALCRRLITDVLPARPAVAERDVA